MAITKEEKLDYAKKYGKDENDTGNTQVQIAILTHRIRELTEHLKLNKKDNHTRLGLMKLVGKRRRLLKYMEKSDITGYRSLIKKLAIRK
ncbi:MAG: 30S ribosomal protein S15 [Candidatus Latescibacteria bacterium]|nr:30S ribosomal protein S15 [Candidatus Latescibacterota bacterium]